jgi:hypothetical protein
MENETLQADFLAAKPAPEPAAPVPAATPEDKRFALVYLLLCGAFAGLVLVNFGLCLLLVYQTKLVRSQLAQNRQAISRYQRIEEPVVKDILNKLEGFGLQNRDYQPILQKYSLLFPRFQQGAMSPSGPPPSSSLAPAPLKPTAK